MLRILLILCVDMCLASFLSPARRCNNNCLDELLLYVYSLNDCHAIHMLIYEHGMMAYWIMLNVINRYISMCFIYSIYLFVSGSSLHLLVVYTNSNDNPIARIEIIYHTLLLSALANEYQINAGYTSVNLVGIP